MSEEISREEIAALLARGSEEMTREPCEDAISRQAALDEIFNNAEKPGDAYRAVRMLAPVTPQQRTGHWIECEDEVKCFCSECKEISDYPTKFCPRCGAKMVEPQESEHNCHTCKHYKSGENDGSCGSYKEYSNWESEG